MNSRQNLLSRLAAAGPVLMARTTGAARARRHQNAGITLVSFGSVSPAATRGQGAGELILIVDPAGGISGFGSRTFALARRAAPEPSEGKVTASGK